MRWFRRLGLAGRGWTSRPDERKPVRRLNAYLRHLRSRMTWGNGGPHSGYRHLADKDEVPGSSPGRPTTHPRRSQRCRQRAGNARCRPGPRWGRTPIPAGTPSRWPPRRAAATTTTHRGRPPSPRTPATRCGQLAPGLLPCPQCRRQPRMLRTPAWPAWPRSGPARPPPPAHNPGPGSATDTPH
jgi:hypothetical protein